MRIFKVFLFIIFVYVPAFAQEQAKLGTGSSKPKKVGLVIGNQNYIHLDALNNTLNDAESMKKSLEALGFIVTIVKDADYETMDTEIIKYLSKVSKNDTVFVYFSGHGINYRRNNYLIPVDMKLLNCEDDIDKKAISLEALSILLNGRTNNVKLIFMDACRNISFLEECIKDNSSNFSAGFSKPINIPRGTFISFATQEGKNAYEVKSETYSRFTAGLLKFLNNPILSFRTIIDSTTNFVEAKSKKDQIPSRFDVLINDFYFNPSKITNPSLIGNIEPQSQCQNCTRQSGYFKAMESGIGLSENSANEKARLNLQSLLVRSMISQLQVAATLKLGENQRNDELNLKDELDRYIKSSAELSIVLYEDECKTISRFQNSAGQNVVRSEICGRIPIKPNLKLMEIYLRNSRLPRKYINELMSILEDSLNDK